MHTQTFKNRTIPRSQNRLACHSVGMTMDPSQVDVDPNSTHLEWVWIM